MKLIYSNNWQNLKPHNCILVIRILFNETMFVTNNTRIKVIIDIRVDIELTKIDVKQNCDVVFNLIFFV